MKNLIIIIIIMISGMKCFFEDGNITIGEEYITKIKFESNLYNTYQLPHGVEIKQIFMNKNRNITTFLEHTYCPEGKQ
jgi:hypothetical protein